MHVSGAGVLLPPLPYVCRLLALPVLTNTLQQQPAHVVLHHHTPGSPRVSLFSFTVSDDLCVLVVSTTYVCQNPVSQCLSVTKACSVPCIRVSSSPCAWHLVLFLRACLGRVFLPDASFLLLWLGSMCSFGKQGSHQGCMRVTCVRVSQQCLGAGLHWSSDWRTLCWRYIV